jgi:hypothetical protein
MDADALEAALARLGAREEAERIREARRADLRGRATLSERVRLLLADEARLGDLGLLAEFEEDLRARLPGHLRALRGAAGPAATALATSLSVTAAEARALAARFGLAIEPPRSRPAPRISQPAPAPRAPTARAPRRPARSAPARATADGDAGREAGAPGRERPRRGGRRGRAR